LPSADFFTDVLMLLNIEDRFFNLLQEIITIIVCWVSLRQPYHYYRLMAIIPHRI
jgi:hypothetical protein